MEELEDKEGDKGEKKGPNWMWIGIIAILIVGIVVATIAITRGKSDVPKLTLAGLAVNVSALEEFSARHTNAIQGLQTTTAQHTEDISDIEAEVAGIPRKNWAEDINTINGDIDNLRGDLVGNVTDIWGELNGLNITIPFNYVTLDAAEDIFLYFTVYGTGDYPIVATIYGLDIMGVYKKPGSNYNVVEEWSMNVTGVNVNTVYGAIIEPVTSWLAEHPVELTITGDIAYATVAIGGA